MEKIHQENNLLPNLPCIAKNSRIVTNLRNFVKVSKEIRGGGFNANHVFSEKKSPPLPNEQIVKKLYAIIRLQ